MHLQEATTRQAYHPDSNYHPDIFHAGTVESTKESRFSNRPYMHEYEVDMSHPSISPVVWGDEPGIVQAQNKVEQNLTVSHPDRIKVLKEFSDSMSGKQEGLFENVPADAQYAAEKGVILPYRNRVEDKGNVSYIVPKSAVGGAVRYVGTTMVPTPYGIPKRKVQ